MATDAKQIKVFKRETGSRSALKQMRREGFIPGTFYSHDLKEALSFKIHEKELQQMFEGDALVYHLDVGGKPKNVIIKEVQHHFVTDEILHVDFQGIRMDDKITISIPIYLDGKPVGVKDEGGQLQKGNVEIEIRCLASEVPSHFDVSIAEMHLGDTLHASDLDIGDVELVTSPDTMIVTVAHAHVVEEEEVSAEEEMEEGAFEFEEEAADASAETAGKSPNSATE